MNATTAEREITSGPSSSSQLNDKQEEEEESMWFQNFYIKL
jgi:hypothetical protein